MERKKVKKVSELLIRPQDRLFKNKFELTHYLIAKFYDEILDYHSLTDYDLKKVSKKLFNKQDNDLYLELEFKKLYLKITPSLYCTNKKTKEFLDNLVDEFASYLHEFITTPKFDDYYYSEEELEDIKFDEEFIRKNITG